MNAILITVMLGVVGCGNAQENSEEGGEEVYSVVDVMPEYPGGMDAMIAYLGENIKYPKDSHDAGVEGKVLVNFIITKDGEVTDVEVMKGVATDLDNEAVRVVKGMPDWTPGSQDGKNVNVQMTLPVMYKLEVDE